MADEDEAKVAIDNLNGYELDGVNIKVEVRYWLRLAQVFCNYLSAFVTKTTACINFYLLPSLPTMQLEEIGLGLSIEHDLYELHQQTSVNTMIFSNCC